MVRPQYQKSRRALPRFALLTPFTMNSLCWHIDPPLLPPIRGR
jgi:hypothetical protein